MAEWATDNDDAVPGDWAQNIYGNFSLDTSDKHGGLGSYRATTTVDSAYAYLVSPALDSGAYDQCIRASTWAKIADMADNMNVIELIFFTDVGGGGDGALWDHINIWAWHDGDILLDMNYPTLNEWAYITEDWTQWHKFDLIVDYAEAGRIQVRLDGKTVIDVSTNTLFAPPDPYFWKDKIAFGAYAEGPNSYWWDDVALSAIAGVCATGSGRWTMMAVL